MLDICALSSNACSIEHYIIPSRGTAFEMTVYHQCSKLNHFFLKLGSFRDIKRIAVAQTLIVSIEEQHRNV